MAALNPYLNFDGTCEEAFNFYKTAFGGEFAMVMRYKDVPPGTPGEQKDNPDWIMHIALPINQNDVLMGSDTPPHYGKATPGKNFSISISADNKQEADKLYKALSAGGQPIMPMADAFWGSYFGMLVDKYGVNWMVGYDQRGKQ
jgi:PhnB protein